MSGYMMAGWDCWWFNAAVSFCNSSDSLNLWMHFNEHCPFTLVYMTLVSVVCRPVSGGQDGHLSKTEFIHLLLLWHQLSFSLTLTGTKHTNQPTIVSPAQLWTRFRHFREEEEDKGKRITVSDTTITEPWSHIPLRQNDTWFFWLTLIEWVWPVSHTLPGVLLSGYWDRFSRYDGELFFQVSHISPVWDTYFVCWILGPAVVGIWRKQRWIPDL